MAKTIYIAGLGLIVRLVSSAIIQISSVNQSGSRDIALERGMIDRATDDFASFAPLAGQSF